MGTYNDNDIEDRLKSMKNGYRFVAELKQAIIVKSAVYMQSFWARMIELCDVEIVEQRLESISDISSQFDIVVLAVGADVVRLWGSKLPLTLIRGRNLIYNAADVPWPSTYGTLIVDKYAIHQPDIGEVVCGSTYEYSADPDIYPYEGVFFLFSFFARLLGSNNGIILAQATSAGHLRYCMPSYIKCFLSYLLQPPHDVVQEYGYLHFI